MPGVFLETENDSYWKSGDGLLPMASSPIMTVYSSVNSCYTYNHRYLMYNNINFYNLYLTRYRSMLTASDSYAYASGQQILAS